MYTPTRRSEEGRQYARGRRAQRDKLDSYFSMIGLLRPLIIIARCESNVTTATTTSTTTTTTTCCSRPVICVVGFMRSYFFFPLLSSPSTHLDIDAGEYPQRHRHGLVVVDRHHLLFLRQTEPAQLVDMDDHVARAVALFPAVRFHRAPFPAVGARGAARRSIGSTTGYIPFPTFPRSIQLLSIPVPRSPFSNLHGKCTIGACNVENATEFSRVRSRNRPTDSVTHNGIYNGGRPQWRARTADCSAARFGGRNATYVWIRARASASATRERERRAIRTAASASERKRTKRERSLKPIERSTAQTPPWEKRREEKRREEIE